MKIVLGPGASGNPLQMEPHARALRAAGHDVEIVTLPRGKAEAAAPVFAARSGPAVVVGGQSFGGRAASLAAAAGSQFTGLLLFSYPLHPPGKPDQLRTTHWPQLRLPVLILMGDRDQFCDMRLLEKELAKLPSARLIVYPGAGHGLKGHLDRALADATAWLADISQYPQTA